MYKNEDQPQGIKRICYYPGCSLKSSSRELGESLFAMAREAGLWIEELKDWNCCGASPAHSLNAEYALMLAGRNLILAEKQGIPDLYVVCPSCFVRLRNAAVELLHSEEKNDKLEEMYGSRFKGHVKLRYFLEAPGLSEKLFEDAVTAPLNGLRAVTYYGCLLARPKNLTGYDVRPYESNIDRFIQKMGVETLEWGYGKKCCGSHLAVSRPEVADRLVDQILEDAERAGANCIVVFCPLCQVNLEMRGSAKHKIPVFFISELFALASKHEHGEKWVKKHLINPLPLLQKHNII